MAPKKKKAAYQAPKKAARVGGIKPTFVAPALDAMQQVDEQLARTVEQARVDPSLRKDVNALITEINTRDKQTIIYRASDMPTTLNLRRPSGIMQLDLDTGGGLPAGSIVVISGPENCLCGDTLVQHEVRSPDGKRVTHKPIPMERLYRRFHGIGHMRKESLTSKTGVYLAPSMNDQGGVVQNRIIDVVCTGDQDCYELRTVNGYSVVGTSKHKFFNGDRYVTLGSIQPGDSVYLHNNTRRTTDAPPVRDQRNFLYVKNHPVAYRKTVRDRTGTAYRYHVLATSRARVEAAMNNISLERYVQRLNEGDLSGLTFLRKDQIVHHVDENTTNDTLDNLLVTNRADHMREHLKDASRDNYMRFMVVEEKVASITHVGRRMTYDLKMAPPFHNYIANHLVVHNSGKTYLLYCYMAMHQRIYGDQSSIAYAYSESGFEHLQARMAGLTVEMPDSSIHDEDAQRATVGLPPLTDTDWRMRKLTIGSFSMIVAPGSGEQFLQAIVDATLSRQYGIIGVDSLSMVTAEKELGKSLDDPYNVRANAMLLTQFANRMSKALNIANGRLNHTTIIATQQVRDNPERATAPAFLQASIPEWRSAGARAIRHSKVIDLTISSGAKVKEPNAAGAKVVVAKYMKWFLGKGKAGTHDNIAGEELFRYPEYFPNNPGVDAAESVLTTGMKYGFIVAGTGKQLMIKKCYGDGYDPLANSVDDLLLRLRIDREFDLQIRQIITYLHKPSAICLYRERENARPTK